MDDSSSSSSSTSSSSSSSLSSDPDYQVATSNLNDDTGTAVLPRSADAEGYTSFLHTQDEVDALCKKYNISKDRYTARPAGNLRASSSPPPGAVCVYVDALEAGMRVPLHPFFGEALAHFGLAPTQLAPNGWRIMAGFVVLCHLAGVSPPPLAVFRCFFVLRPLNQKHKKGWYFFQSRSRDSSGLRFTGLPDSIKDWKRWFFFLSSPTPWPCPVEWGEPSKTSLMEPVLTNEKVSAEKLLTAYGGAAVETRTCLSDSNLAAAIVTAASPSPPPLRTHTSASSIGIGMDTSVYNMMKTMLAKKVKTEQGSSPLCRKKRNLDEATGEVGSACYDTPANTHGYSAPAGVCPPLPGLSWNGHDGDDAHREAARKLLQGAVAPRQQSVFAANKPSEVVTSSYTAILEAANYVSFSLSYALELEQKLMARDVEVAALRQQLEEVKGKLAAKVAAEAEADRKGGDSRRAARRT